MKIYNKLISASFLVIPFIPASALAVTDGFTGLKQMPPVTLSVGSVFPQRPQPIMDLGVYDYFDGAYTNKKNHSCQNVDFNPPAALSGYLTFDQNTCLVNFNISPTLTWKQLATNVKDSSKGCVPITGQAGKYRCDVDFSASGSSVKWPVVINTGLSAKSIYGLMKPHMDDSSKPYYPEVAMTQAEATGYTVLTQNPFSDYFNNPNNDKISYSFSSSQICDGNKLCPKNTADDKYPGAYIGGIGNSLKLQRFPSTEYPSEMSGLGSFSNNWSDVPKIWVYPVIGHAGPQELGLEQLVPGLYQINVKATDESVSNQDGTHPVAYQTFYLYVTTSGTSYSDWSKGKMPSGNVLGFNSGKPGEPLNIDKAWTGMYMYFPGGRDGGKYDYNKDASDPNNYYLRQDLTNYAKTFNTVNKSSLMGGRSADIRAVYGELSDMEYTNGYNEDGNWPVASYPITSSSTADASDPYANVASIWNAGTKGLSRPIDFTTTVDNLNSGYDGKTGAGSIEYLYDYPNTIKTLTNGTVQAELAINFQNHIGAHSAALDSDMRQQLASYMAYVAETDGGHVNPVPYQGIVFDLEWPDAPVNNYQMIEFFKALSDRLAYHGQTTSIFGFSDNVSSPLTIGALGPMGYLQYSTYDVSPGGGSTRVNAVTNSSSITGTNKSKLEAAGSYKNDQICSEDNTNNQTGGCIDTLNDSFFSNYGRYTQPVVKLPNGSKTSAYQSVQDYNGNVQLTLPIAASASQNGATAIWNPHLQTQAYQPAIPVNKFWMKKFQPFPSGSTYASDFPSRTNSSGKSVPACNDDRFLQVLDLVDVRRITNTTVDGNLASTDCQKVGTFTDPGMILSNDGDGNIKTPSNPLSAAQCQAVTPSDFGQSAWPWGGNASYPLAYVAARSCLFEGPSDYVTGDDPATAAANEIFPIQQVTACPVSNILYRTDRSASDTVYLPYWMCAQVTGMPGTVSPSGSYGTNVSSFLPHGLVKTGNAILNPSAQYYFWANSAAYNPANVGNKNETVERYMDPHFVGFGLFAMEDNANIKNGLLQPVQQGKFGDGHPAENSFALPGIMGDVTIPQNLMMQNNMALNQMLIQLPSYNNKPYASAIHLNAAYCAPTLSKPCDDPADQLLNQVFDSTTVPLMAGPSDTTPALSRPGWLMNEQYQYIQNPLYNTNLNNALFKAYAHFRACMASNSGC